MFSPGASSNDFFSSGPVRYFAPGISTRMPMGIFSSSEIFLTLFAAESCSVSEP